MMKHKASRLVKILSLITCLCMIFATFAVFPAYAATRVSVQNGTGTREALHVTDSFAYRAKVNGEFSAFSFCMPTWKTTDATCTLYLYQWKNNFSTTISSEPIAEKTFTNMVDGNHNTLSFDPQPAGEYLFAIGNVSGQAGVWTNTSPVNSKGFLYLNGIEQRGEPELNITFTEAVDEPFGNCQSTQKARNPKMPYQSYSNEGVTNLSATAGVRLNVKGGFSGVEFKMATYLATDIDISLSVYEWMGTYSDTVAEDPVATDTLTLIDNIWQGISFDELPAGDYLFELHDYTSGTPALYGFGTATGFEGVVYTDGYAVSNIKQFPEIRVIFNEVLDDGVYFLPCEASDDGITGEHIAPPEYVIPSDSLILTHPVMPDTWVFTDGLGRVSLTNAEVGDPRDDRTLAMFYWTWHIDNQTAKNPANVQELSEQYPDAMRDYDNPLWSTLGNRAFHWNESIYGYYSADDTWVLRRQAELLTNAGVDVIFTDNTNGTFTWRNAYTALMDTWSDAMNDGVNTPKVSFMLPFTDMESTNTQLQTLYQDIFRQGKHQNLWYYLDGQPMLMANQNAVNAATSPLEKEISSFFTFRAGQPGYVISDTNLKSWGWLSTHPQAKYYKTRNDKRDGIVEQMTVGVAMNHNYELGMISAMSGNHVMGRSYTSDYQNRFEVEGNSASKWGYNFAEQFNYALEVDPKVIFVTGWNELTAGRYKTWPEGLASAVENAFPDQYNDEFSRDIEPSKGELKDHYYYQLVNFVRQYKGARAIPTAGGAVTIDLTKGQNQWKNVAPYYAAYIGNTDDRNAEGYGDLVYTETSGRNDIMGAQIARDDDYVYFNVECAENITPYTDSLWMNLYLDTNQENQGWETFEFVVNKSAASADTVVLERFTGKGYESEKVADCAYTVDGRYMTVKIAKSDLGLSGQDFTVNFAWTDNVHDEGDDTTFSGDIMDFYISGDVAPGARFKYSYISTAENASAEVPPYGEDTETDTGVNEDVTDAEAATDAEGNTPADTATDTSGEKSTVEVTPDGSDTTHNTAAEPADSDTAESDDSAAGSEAQGCSSALSAWAGLMTAVTAAGVVLCHKKRKEEA